MSMLHRTVRLLPRVAAGAAIVGPLAWSIEQNSRQDDRAAFWSPLAKRTALCELQSFASYGLMTHSSDGRPLYGEVFMKLIHAAPQKTIKAGEYFFRNGDDAHDMYVILSGVVDVVTPNLFSTGVTVQDEMTAGSFFGEIALLERHSKRQRCVLAKTDVEVVVISTAAFEEALHQTNLHLHVDSSHDERVLAFINMVSPTKTAHLVKGETVFKQGDVSDPAFYIVNEGSLECLQANLKRQPEVKIENIPAGHCFGFVSLLANNPYAKKQYTLKCSSPTCELLVVRGDDFHRLLDHSQVVSKMMQHLIKERSDHTKQAKTAAAVGNVTRFRGI